MVAKDISRHMLTRLLSSWSLCQLCFQDRIGDEGFLEFWQSLLVSLGLQLLLQLQCNVNIVMVSCTPAASLARLGVSHQQVYDRFIHTCVYIAAKAHGWTAAEHEMLAFEQSR